MSPGRLLAADEIRLASADIVYHAHMSLGLPAGEGTPGRLAVTHRALHLELADRARPLVLTHATMRRSLLRGVRYGVRGAHRRGVIEVPLPDSAPAYLAVRGGWDAAVALHQAAVEAWSRYHSLRAGRPPLRDVPTFGLADVRARIGRYLRWAGLGPEPALNGFPVLLHPHQTYVEVVVPAARGVRPDLLTDADAPFAAAASGALLRLRAAGDRWDLVATTHVPAAPPHLVDLDHAVKTTVVRAMEAQPLGLALGGTPVAPPSKVPPVRRDTGEPLLDPRAENSLQRVLTSLEALDVPVDRYHWRSGMAHIAAGPLLVRLQPPDGARTVAVLAIDMLYGEMPASAVTAAQVLPMLRPSDAANRLSLRQGADSFYLTHTVEIPLVETAHGSLRAALLSQDQGVPQVALTTWGTP